MVTMGYGNRLRKRLLNMLCNDMLLVKSLGQMQMDRPAGGLHRMN
jgi:hypothetical protein